MQSATSVCWLCYRVAAPNLKAIIRHMATSHAYDPNFFICCGIEGCSRTYSNFYSFKKQVYRKHRCCLSMLGPFVASSSLNTTEEDTLESGEDPVEMLDEEQLEISDAEESNELSKFQYLKQMAIFLLKTKEVRKVSQVALEGLIADFTSMLQLTISQIKCEVSTVLKDNGVSLSTFEGLESIFHNSLRNQPFYGLESKFLQEKFYREHQNNYVGKHVIL